MRAGEVMRGLVGAALCGVVSACYSTKTVRSDSVVVVKDLHITDQHPWVSHFARHTLIEFRESTEAPWWRVEIPNPHDGIVLSQVTDEDVARRERAGRRVRVLKQYGGVDGAKVARRIRSVVEGYEDSVYRPWPGPNSNTFIETVLRETEGVSAQLAHNAVGKEYGWYVGPTAGGTGLEAQTTYLGTAVGFREGVEVNVLGFTTGVGFWPPRLKLPVLPEVPMRR